MMDAVTDALGAAFDAGVAAKTHAYAMPTAQGRDEYVAQARAEALAENADKIQPK